MHDQRTCLACGKPFTPTQHQQNTCPPTDEQRARCKGQGQVRSKCSRLLMRNRARGLPDNTPPVKPPCLPYDCAQCGKPCIPGVDVVPHASRFCGVPCKKAWHRAHGVAAEPERQEQRRLSARRRYRRIRAERILARAALGTEGERWVAGPCAECGQPYVSKWHSLWPARYCSRPCQRRAERRRGKLRFGYANWNHRKRARLLGLEYESINSRILFERDGYRCGLCRRKTKRNAKVPDPRAPTVDHIIPMSQGGPHLWTNVQCACFECNWRKGDGATNDQLLLVG